MQNATLIVATMLVLCMLQVLFLAPLLLELPLTPIIILGGFAAVKVALLALLLTFGNHVEGGYSAGARAGSRIRGLQHQMELGSYGFPSSPLIVGTQDLLWPASAWTTKQAPQLTVKVPAAVMDHIMKADSPKLEARRQLRAGQFLLVPQ